MGVDWPNLDPTKEDLEYMHMSGPGKFSMERDSNFGNKKFWNTIDFNENKLN